MRAVCSCLQLWGTPKDRGSSASGAVTGLHRFQLVRWKLSFTSTIPTLIHRVTVLNIKDHRQVKKLIFWVGSATISLRAWLSSQKKSLTWIKDDPIFQTWSIKDCWAFLLTQLHSSPEDTWCVSPSQYIFHLLHLYTNVKWTKKPHQVHNRSVFKAFATFVQTFAFLLFSR